ncbi:MAG: ABC transporter ATP-binding protein [Anaerolineae bacterium]|nr:ABC transporter ATP-binding protein [Anaerolineae bacterium]
MPNVEVQLQDVTKKFGDFVAVDNVSLEVADGEFFSLLGPSGCGKTTCLRMIAGFELPTLGDIKIGGKPMGDTPPFKRPVNTVFQNYALFPHMTIFENVAFGLEMKKVAHSEIRPQVMETLEMVRLPQLADRKPRQLSGGQQQRIALARALVNRPEVLLLDEPLSALDLKLRKAMQFELKALQQQVGITFIFVTHDQEEAITMSDRIAVMSDGVVQQVGDPIEIYERPNNRFVADFIGETNFIEGEVAETNADHTLVALSGGVKLPARAITGLTPGQTVTVAIRPEKITLHTSPPANGASIPATVNEAVYIGTDTRYTVRLGDRHDIVARLQNMGSPLTDGGPLQRGTQVYVSWVLDSAMVLTS